MENLSFEYKLYKAHRNEKNIIFLKRALRLKLPAGFLICNIISLTEMLLEFVKMGHSVNIPGGNPCYMGRSSYFWSSCHTLSLSVLLY